MPARGFWVTSIPVAEGLAPAVRACAEGFSSEAELVRDKEEAQGLALAEVSVQMEEPEPTLAGLSPEDVSTAAGAL